PALAHGSSMERRRTAGYQPHGIAGRVSIDAKKGMTHHTVALISGRLVAAPAMKRGIVSSSRLAPRAFGDNTSYLAITIVSGSTAVGSKSPSFLNSGDDHDELWRPLRRAASPDILPSPRATKRSLREKQGCQPRQPP